MIRPQEAINRHPVAADGGSICGGEILAQRSLPREQMAISWPLRSMIFHRRPVRVADTFSLT